ncbi:MAG TPA: hypothetical protein DIU15_20280 [Deltaproteobacteria bacterium]|nr:hypothetical protein [Deltaproteobacteria bacterium]HCP48387.1 hypothetical protein [Deltaproteobacteria bacterium]
MSSDDPQDPPRTHRWFRREQPASTARREDHPVTVQAPSGSAPDPEALQEQICAALAGWPVATLKLVGSLEEKGKIPRPPGRFLRAVLGHLVDTTLCTCRGYRCTSRSCIGHQLLGRRARGPDVDGEAWSPLAVRASNTKTGVCQKGGRIGAELLFVGHEAVRQLPRLIEVLRDPPPPPEQHPPITWNTVQYLQLDEDRELRWRKASEDGGGVPPLALDLLTEPRVRKGRLTLTFLSPTPLVRRLERGVVVPELPLVIDRMTRGMGAWMGRTGHKGPRLPVDDLLRVASAAQLGADNTRTVDIPGRLLGAQGNEPEDDESRVPSLMGSITWKGDFSGLAPLLRAVNQLGMGPGKQYGLGEVNVR